MECKSHENMRECNRAVACRHCPDLIDRRKKEMIKIPHTGEHRLEHAKEGDAGYDITSAMDGIVYAGGSQAFKTGLKMAIPRGYVGMVVSRSGLSFRHSIEVGAGVIDSGYRGEIMINLHNLGALSFPVKKGDRIAQVLILKHEDPDFEMVEELPADTERGESGFGHTGV